MRKYKFYKKNQIYTEFKFIIFVNCKSLGRGIHMDALGVKMGFNMPIKTGIKLGVYVGSTGVKVGIKKSSGS